MSFCDTPWSKETAITLDVIAFIVLSCVFAVYGLYVSATSLRDPVAAHLTLGPARPGLLAHTGGITASFAAVGLFLTPWLAREGGYPACTTALIGITVPLMASLLTLRGWTVARLVGAKGIGDMFAATHGKGVGIITGLLIAACALILMALSLLAAGSLIEALSSEVISRTAAIHLAALFLVLTGAPAGIHAAGKLARLHSGLVLLGAGAACVIIFMTLGGWDGVARALAAAGRILDWGTTGGRGGGDYSLALAVSGAFGAATAWTGTTILSIQVALGGSVLMLVWLPRAIAVRNPRRFTRQIGYGASVGGALLLATTFLLGLATLRIDRPSAPGPRVPLAGDILSSGDIARLIDTIADERFWGASALLGLGAGAALHALALALLTTAVSALRPLWSRQRATPTGVQRDLAISQSVAGGLIVAALCLTFLPADEFATLCALALSLAPLAILPFAAACWFPGLSQSGLAAGILIGIVIVIVEVIAGTPAYAAVSGLAAAAIIAAAMSLARRRDSRWSQRHDLQTRMSRIFMRAPEERGSESGLRLLALFAAAIWIFFAIGPGIVIGNDMFGAPNQPRVRWDFPIPSIAAWQVLAWASGVGLVWFFTHILGLSVINREQLNQIEAAASNVPAQVPRTDPSNEDP